MKKYTIKHWPSKKAFNKGEAINLLENVEIDLAKAKAATSLQSGKSFHVEIFDTKTGETYFHSNENPVFDLL